jgi:hypothetical protein
VAVGVLTFGLVRFLGVRVSFLAGYRRREVVDLTLAPMVVDATAARMTFAGLERSVPGPRAMVRPTILHLLWTSDASSPRTSEAGPLPQREHRM